MSLLYPKFTALFLLCVTIAAAGSSFRVCADPNNLPFSNRQGEGFENKIAALLAANMNTTLQYTWWSQRKNFAKHSFEAGACDAIMGVAVGMEDVSTTAPYYRSTYVFVSRRDRNLDISSLADPRLTELKIGVHVVGDDLAPPAYALAHRGITQNVSGFSLFGPDRDPNPARKLIDAVESGQMDLAIAWGPLAGYFAHRESNPLDVHPVQPPTFMGVPFTYDIAVAVRQGNEDLRIELNRILQSESAAIQRILTSYDVPQVP